MSQSLPPYLSVIPGGVELRLKVVPNSSRSQIVGPYGDRLKVKVASPPEAGKANADVVQLLRKFTGCKDVTVVGGLANPEKTVRIMGADVASVDWPR